ncbi:MAG TPA: hypothetical protein VNX70_09150 [Bryobacteraceae bacterium]|nr:hypothetical protein [Bryobacteraceae bacterium]
MSRVAFALLFGWVTVAIGPAQSPAEAAAQLAARISSQLQRHPTVSLELQNLSPMTSADLSGFGRALEEELRKSGLPMTAIRPETRVRITASENTRGLLLVAEIFSGENRTVMIQPWIAPPRSETKPRVTILRTPIWDQPEPVLDLLLLDSGSELLVLSPAVVSTFRMTGGKWIPGDVAALSLARPPARDPRGRIENVPAGFRVYLPGTTCSATLQPALKVACAPGNDAWPMNLRDASFVDRWVTGRNVLESPSFQSPFYAGANGWFSTADHRILDRTGNALALPGMWGSDFAQVENPCVPDPTVLASGSGDNPDQDHAQAFEIASGRAAPLSEPLTLPGPITALWPAETTGQATLVVRNSKTGNYEASRLGVACTQ